MLRGLKIFGLAATAILLLAIVLVVVLRTMLAGTLISMQLASMGIPVASLSVSKLDLGQLVVEKMVLGRQDELSIDSVTVRYSPELLLSGRLNEVQIDRLRLRLDASNSRSPLGSLQPLLAEGRGAGGAGLFPERVILTGGSIEAKLPEGPATMAVTGRWNANTGKAALSVTRIELPQVELEAANIDIEATARRILATAKAKGRDDALDLDMRATVDSYGGKPSIDLELDGGLWPDRWRLPPWAPATGAAKGSLRMKGSLQPFEELRRGAALMEWLLGAELHGTLDASLTDAAYESRAEGISGALDVKADLTGGRLELQLADDARLDIARIDSAWLADVNAPPILRPLLEGGLSVVLPAAGPGFAVGLQPDAAGADMTISGSANVLSPNGALDMVADGSVSLDRNFNPKALYFQKADARATDVELAGRKLESLHFRGSVKGPVGALAGAGDLEAKVAATQVDRLRVGAATVALAAGFQWDGNRIDLRQQGEGKATLASLRVADAARATRSVTARLADASLALEAVRDGVSVSGAITLRPGPATLDLLRSGRPPIALNLVGGTFSFTGTSAPGSSFDGKLEISEGRLEIPDYAVFAEALSASVALPLPPAGRVADIAGGKVSYTQEPAYFAPFRVRGSVDRKGDSLILRATATDKDRKAQIAMRGEQRMANGSGMLSIKLPEVTFDSSLQPAQLFPVLGAVRDAAGRFTADAAISWAAGTTASKGHIDLAGLSFTTDAATIQELNSRVTFDGLFPLSTPPGQKITIGRVDPAMPLDQVEAEFRIEPAARPRLHIAHAQADFAGGRLGLGETVLDLARARNEVTVDMKGVDLSRLLERLRVEDVSGTGRLDGSIPVVLQDGTALVSDGHLEAQGPGVLHVRSEAAKSALGGAGDQVRLMLSALEDFRYESLSATLNMPGDDEASVTVHMKGNNPAVLEGYPFAFNIDLTGNLGKLLGALRQGAALSTDIIRPKAQ